MKVSFRIHGLGQLVDGVLDIQDAPMPQVGWELEFDTVGGMRVVAVTAYYVALGEHGVTMDLAPFRNPGDAPEWQPEVVVEFFRVNSDELTAFSEVELGDYCHCELCS